MASDKPTCDDKKDPIKLDSEESPIGSSVDGESGEPGEGEGDGEGTGLAIPPEQAPKRKGGRKPVCDEAFLCYQRSVGWACRGMQLLTAERTQGSTLSWNWCLPLLV